MTWWHSISASLSVGTTLQTPGRGIPATRQGRFTIQSVGTIELVIISGSGQISIEKTCFDIIEKEFYANPHLSLRVASLHDNTPFPDSVDKLIRGATGSNLARGNYVSSILEYCGLVKYSLKGKQKVIVRA